MLKLLDRAIARKYPYKPEEEIRAEVESAYRDAGAHMARRYVRGNVNVQSGRYLTRADLDARAERLAVSKKK
jgi:hypothetical protein